MCSMGVLKFSWRKTSPESFSPNFLGQIKASADWIVNCGIFLECLSAEAYDPRAAETDGRQLSRSF